MSTVTAGAHDLRLVDPDAPPGFVTHVRVLGVGNPELEHDSYAPLAIARVAVAVAAEAPPIEGVTVEVVEGHGHLSQLMAVTHTDAAALQRWIAWVSGAGCYVQLVTDPQRRAA